MHSEKNQVCAWRVLLIGGSSGVGKTVVARELAKHLSLPLLLVDDIRLALQQTTSNATHLEIHVFLNYQKEQWRNPQSIFTDWITVGREMTRPLSAIINHHIIVPDVGAIIIEGDGILPMVRNLFPDAKDVRMVFIVEEDETQLLQNLQARGRGFNEWNGIEQESFAHASWLYGQWLVQETKRLELTVIQARPHATLLERLLTVADVQ